MMTKILGVVGAIVMLTVGLGCVDTEAGESGYYGSPCTGPLHRLLQCNAGSGGADPAGDGTSAQASDGTFGCTETCALFVDCGFFDPQEQNGCLAECQSDPLTPSLFECIRVNGCDSINVCEG